MIIGEKEIENLEEDEELIEVIKSLSKLKLSPPDHPIYKRGFVIGQTNMKNFYPRPQEEDSEDNN